MENKHATAGIDDLLFVWNHIHERFRQLQLYKPEPPKKELTPDQLEEKEQEKGRTFYQNFSQQNFSDFFN